MGSSLGGVEPGLPAARLGFDFVHPVVCVPSSVRCVVACSGEQTEGPWWCPHLVFGEKKTLFLLFMVVGE